MGKIEFCRELQSKGSLKDTGKTDKHGKSVHSSKITESTYRTKNTLVLMEKV